MRTGAPTVDRVAVVSGGGTGIGRATARALARDGAHVLILGRRLHVLESAAENIRTELGEASISFLRADVTDVDDVGVVADHVRSAHGTIDAVVNNAGAGSGRQGEGLGGVAATWRATFESNVLSAALLTNALSPMLRRPGGSVVLVSSMASKSGGGGGAYVAAKGALNAWVLALTAELAPQGIRSNVVVPGYTPDTELFGAGMPKELHERIVSRIALGRAGRSDDVAGAIRFLVSEEASFITGQVLDVAGGVLPPNM
jgi:3-oxoacyl-[acyl-carrier protein] reductase